MGSWAMPHSDRPYRSRRSIRGLGSGYAQVALEFAPIAVPATIMKLDLPYPSESPPLLKYASSIERPPSYARTN